MKACVHCLKAPEFWNARMVTQRDGIQTYLCVGRCGRCEPFTKAIGFVQLPDLKDAEAKWDAKAEELFAAYTTRMTDPERASFRARLFLEYGTGQLPLMPATTADVAAAKKWNEAHPAKNEPTL